MDAIVLDVKGMTCDGCVRSVKRVVAAKTGAEAEVSLDEGQVRLPAGTDVEAAVTAITKAGFEVVAPS